MGWANLPIYYPNNWQRQVHQYALSKLKENNFKLVVCSNSIRNTIQVMMERSDLLGFLEFFLSNQDVVNGKPDPEIYNKAIQKLGLLPNECLILEDNENGINAALASGAHLLKINSVQDVNYLNIMNKINEINNNN